MNDKKERSQEVEVYYKIGDFAKIFNVTTETIRYYERMGIISSSRSEFGTRFYDSFALVTLFFLKYKQVVGFSNKDIAYQKQNITIPNMIDSLHEQEKSLQKELELQQMKMHYLQQKFQNLKIFKEKLGQYEVGISTEMIFWNLIDGNQKNEAVTKQIQLNDDVFMMSDIGFSIKDVRYPFCIESKDRKFGIVMEKRIAEQYDINILPQHSVLPSQKCLIVYFSDMGGRMIHKLSDIMNELNDQYSFCGNPWGVWEFEEYIEGKRCYYFKAYLPIKE